MASGAKNKRRSVASAVLVMGGDGALWEWFIMAFLRKSIDTLFFVL
jgi:hypothetical protein